MCFDCGVVQKAADDLGSPAWVTVTGPYQEPCPDEDHRWSPTRHGSADEADLATRLKNARWKFASTMADNPHWYIVRKWDLELYDEMERRIREDGYDEVWKPNGRTYRYLEVGCWRYWIVEPVLNRKPVDMDY